MQPSSIVLYVLEKISLKNPIWIDIIGHLERETKTTL